MTRTGYFTLDPSAAEWISANIRQTEDFYSGETSDPPAVEILAGYDPQDDEDGAVTYDLVAAAHHAGIITGPGHVDFDYVADADGEVGFVWLLYLDGPGAIKMSTLYSKIKWLGDGKAYGGRAHALGVLRDAVSAANELLDDLDHYYAAHRS